MNITTNDEVLSPADIAQTVSTLWRSVVPQEESVGSFFELGGDSIDAVRFVADLEQKFGYRIPFALLASERGHDGISQWLIEKLRDEGRAEHA